MSLERLSLELVHSGRVFMLGESTDSKGRKLPLLALSFGAQDPAAPTLVLTGGVHGLERIGSQVVLAFLNSFGESLLWDKLLQEALRRIRIVFFPIVNPWGVFHKTRANPNGVDLMRNAPVESEETTFLVGGHRYSPKLWWYRGQDTKMEVESQAVLDLMIAQAFESSRIISVDVHSGFGTRDRIWFPFARSRKPFPHLAEIYAFKEAFERIHPHHFYQIEPQAKNYTTHGDLWDHAYDVYYQSHDPRASTFLPLAVEMGSWMWVKKNPLQLFSTLGPFNPMKPHRLKRILRRHNSFFDFLVRSLVSHEVWVPQIEEQREKLRDRGMAEWYPELWLREQKS